VICADAAAAVVAVAMTAYSPSVLAMNEMLRQQLHMTREFISVQRRLHHELVTSLHSAAESHRYTTLSDTRRVSSTPLSPV